MALPLVGPSFFLRWRGVALVSVLVSVGLRDDRVPYNSGDVSWFDQRAVS